MTRLGSISTTSGNEDTLFPRKFTLNSRGKLLMLDRPWVMGILNATPDSFYGGSRVSGVEAGLTQATKMLAEGADILDVGGYSTRPGADEVTEQEEIDRTAPLIQAILQRHPEALVSIDTFRAGVARAALEQGAHFVNDVSAGHLDERMLSTVAAFRVPYIAMHMRGNPQTMQSLTSYEDLLQEMLLYFAQVQERCGQAGIHDVIFDPGFGFAKTLEQNYEILRHLNTFPKLLGPILVGISRKSMIYRVIDTDAEGALAGTTALHMVALQQGANVLRVHDVLEAVQTIKLFKTLYS